MSYIQLALRYKDQNSLLPECRDLTLLQAKCVKRGQGLHNTVRNTFPDGEREAIRARGRTTTPPASSDSTLDLLKSDTVLRIQNAAISPNLIGIVDVARRKEIIQ